jgi:hypothetical protein
VNDITEEVSKQLGLIETPGSKSQALRELRDRMRELSRNLFNARAVALDRLLAQSSELLPRRHSALPPAASTD